MARNKKKYEFNVVKSLPLVLAIVVLLFTFGYATVTDSMSVIDGKAFVRIDKNIRLTDFSLDTSANDGTSSYENFSYKNAYSTAVLPNSNSSVTYNVGVTNIGNVEMGIIAINGLPSNLKYTFIGYNLESALCDSLDNTQCSLGSVTNFQMIIEYDENGYDGVNTIYNLNLEFIFEEMIYTARIGQNKYLTIQNAIDAAPTDGTETTIVLLKNVYQRIQIWRGNNIVLDMPNLVLHNKEFTNNTGDPVVEIFGARDKQHKSSDDANNVGSAVFKMTNGTIISEANQGAVNVEMGGTFIMTGGSILASGNRQAVYIRNGGSAQIGGTSYLKATAEPALTSSSPNYRATIHNVSGNLAITGGTIEAVGDNGIALMSESTTTIGTKDGIASTTVPTFVAVDTGIRIKSGTTFNFYDGVAKGKVTAIINENEIDDIETGYDIVHNGDVINNDNYYVAHLAHGVTLTFDLDGGSQDELSRLVAPGEPVGPLPTPTKTNNVFDGWYDANDNLVNSNSTISANATFTAHWIDLSAYTVARIGNIEYTTLAEAVNNVPQNTETTITILHDIELSAIIVIPSTKNIIIDLNGNTIDTTVGTVFQNEGILKIDDSGTTGVLTGGMVSGGQITVINNKSSGTLYIRGGTITSNKSQVIDNNGTMYITGGKITIDFNQGVINNNSGATLNMSGGEITVTVAGSRRQAIYNKGTVNISGSASLSSASTDRATLQNDDNNARMMITGGTIISTNINCQRGAVQNGKGTLIVTGGTIISNSTNAVAGPSGIQNTGTCTIGVQGGGIDITTPVIRGVNSGIYNSGSGTVDIYDGVLQSAGSPLSGTYRNIETNSQPNTSGITQIGGVTYHTWYLESTN